MRMSWKRGALAGAALCAVTLVASCGGDDVLGPPDAAACTVGTIAAGDSVSGNVSGSSCLLWSDYNYVETRAESWTLHAKKNTAYIVRLRHQSQDTVGGFDNWSGDLALYGRNAQGDPEFETGWWDSFGVGNGNSGVNEEMMLATDRDQTWSIRVESASKADTGAYSLTVESCPLHPLTTAAPVTGVNVTATGCYSLTFQAAATRIAFFSYPGDSLTNNTVTSTRTAGAAYQHGEITGPDNDVSSWTSSSYRTNFSGDTTQTSGIYHPAATGRQTLWVGVNADSAATVSVSMTSAPIPAPRPFSSTPRPARRGAN